MTPVVRRQLGRTDRYVCHSRLRVPPDAPRRKLAFLTEEALRLCSLPGEEEGRVYYFRRLSIGGLTAEGDRRAWLDAFQSAMKQQAADSVHGLNPRAAASDAVFFHSPQEACESLFKLIAARVVPVAWFWPHVSGSVRPASPGSQLVAVVERLLETPAGWTAVAAAVLSVAGQFDAARVLPLLPDAAVSAWLRELGAEASAAAPVRLSPRTAGIVAQSLAAFGAEEPRVLWLASLAVIDARPDAAEKRVATPMARAIIRQWMAENAPSPRPLPPRAQGRPQAEPPVQIARSPRPEQPASDSAAPGDAQAVDVAPALNAFLFGEPTRAAGLYFLLNALDRLGMAQAGLGLLFLARLFLQIAERVGVQRTDPILRWAEVVEAESEAATIDARLLRLWELKLRGWCWRNGRLKLAEIVLRSGYVTLTRTDLDVTMAVESADVRIRRIGLDLDPGWLPWFGRVVRFHYRYRGELCG